MVGQLTGKIGMGFLCDKIGVTGATTVGCISGAAGMVLLIMGSILALCGRISVWNRFCPGDGTTTGIDQANIWVERLQFDIFVCNDGNCAFRWPWYLYLWIYF
jgi:hypothetical protein